MSQKAQLVLQGQQEKWRQFQEEFPIRAPLVPRINNILHDFASGDISELPPILITGSLDLPLRLLWQEGIRKRFDSPHFLKHNPIDFIGTESKITYYTNERYILFDLMHPDTNKGISLIYDVLRHHLSSRSLRLEKRIVIIEHIDQILKNRADVPIQALLDKYTHNTWFICTTHNCKSLSMTLQSRFHTMVVPALTPEECITLIPNHSVQAENQDQQCGLMNNLFYPNIKPPCWTTQFLEMCQKRCTIGTPEFIRKTATHFCQRLVQPSLLVQELLNALGSDRAKHRFTEIATEIEHQNALIRNSLEPICYEKLLWVFYEIYKTS